ALSTTRLIQRLGTVQARWPGPCRPLRGGRSGGSKIVGRRLRSRVIFKAAGCDVADTSRSRSARLVGALAQRAVIRRPFGLITMERSQTMRSVLRRVSDSKIALRRSLHADLSG